MPKMKIDPDTNLSNSHIYFPNNFNEFNKTYNMPKNMSSKRDINTLKSTVKIIDTRELPFEDQEAESVDSGCIADLSTEAKPDQLQNLELILDLEYGFATHLLQHTLAPELQGQSKEGVIDDVFGRNKARKESQSSEDDDTDDTDDDEQVEESQPAVDQPKSKKSKAHVKSKKDKSLASSVSKPQQQVNKLDKFELVREISKLQSFKYGKLNPMQGKERLKKLKAKLVKLNKKEQKLAKKVKVEINIKGQEKGSKYPTTNSKQIFSKSGKLVFSKFDFSDAEKDRWTDKKKPDLNYYLSNVLKEKEKVKSLKNEGKADEAVKTLENRVWDFAMKKAQGEKVKNDPEKLMKSLKKKQQQKKKSKTNWTERKRMQTKMKTQREEKKQQNRTKRKQAKLEKKNKNKKKRKGKVPGF